jgi:hypothetical protein
MNIRVQKEAARLLTEMGLDPGEVAVTFHAMWEERLAKVPECDGVGGAIKGQGFFGGVREDDGEKAFVLVHLPRE